MRSRQSAGSVLAKKILRARQRKVNQQSGSRKPHRQRFIKWGAGVLAAAAATLSVAIATNSAADIWHHVYDLFNHPEPLVVSPASVAPTTGIAAPVPGTNLPASSQPSRTIFVLIRDNVEYILPGNLSVSQLPKIGSLPKDTLQSPETSWILDLNITGTESSPTIITGMSIHIISRLHPRIVTVVSSCWQNKCTPTRSPLTSPPLGAVLPVRPFFANLDTGDNNVSITPEGKANFPFTVTEYDVESFSLTVSAETAGYMFVVYVNWVQGSRSGQWRVDNFGQPFSVTPDFITNHYCYDSGRPRGYADVKDQNAVSRICDISS